MRKFVSFVAFIAIVVIGTEGLFIPSSTTTPAPNQLLQYLRSITSFNEVLEFPYRFSSTEQPNGIFNPHLIQSVIRYI